VCVSGNPCLHCGWRDSDQPPSQDGVGGNQLKAGDKLWVDAQMIEILKGHNLGRKFRLNTGVVEVAGDIYTDDTMVPKELNVKIGDARWVSLPLGELERPWRYPTFRRLLAVIRSWTGDWLFRARKKEQGIDIEETINNEENDNDQS
jgi:hypothetical protein